MALIEGRVLRWALVGTSATISSTLANICAFQGGCTKVSGCLVVLDTSKVFMIIVEYVMEAIYYAGTVLAVLAKDGIILAAEKKVTGKLLDLPGTEGGYGGSGEKIFLLNSYVPSSLSPSSLSFTPHDPPGRVETSSPVLPVLQRMPIPS